MCSFNSDTTPPRSMESQTLIQEIDWLDSEGSVSYPNTDATEQVPRSQVVDNQQQPMTPLDYQQPSTSSFLNVPSVSHHRPRSPRITDEEWQTSTAPIPEFEFNDGSVGPQFYVDANTSPIEIFNRFFPLSTIEQLVERTNKYGAALCNMNRPHTRHSRKRTFNPTSIGEMKRFLGLCILQSHVETPNIRKLFTFSDPLYYHPIFNHCMSGRRFEQLLRCLCVYEGNAKGINKTEKLVLNLMQPYLYLGHELYMDNYYNSVALSDKLLSCMTHTTGTLRKDRKDNPKDVIRKVLKKGFDNLTCSNIISSRKPTNPRTSNNSGMTLPNSNQGSSQEGASSQLLNTHWPEPIPKTENCKRNKAFLKCRLCAKNKIKKETSYRCKGCTSKPPLCPGCFEQWHCQAENID
ncbi:hypothetical protein SFRURICE_001255 [Spodoptera frugiperda]|nr:hypothetical protein SFRURICE_001255 [Spodoptera frugiperda]